MRDVILVISIVKYWLIRGKTEAVGDTTRKIWAGLDRPKGGLTKRTVWALVAGSISPAAARPVEQLGRPSQCQEPHCCSSSQEAASPRS